MIFFTESGLSVKFSSFYNGLTLPSAKACNYVPVQVVVELNEEIIKRDTYDTTVLKDGDVVEILQFMGGGSC